MNLRLPGLFALLLCVATAHAQMSLQTAVDLALSRNPRLKAAGDDITKARASISEVKSAYIPTVIVGGGYGDSFGYTNNLPTFFAFQTQSLVFNYSQLDYLRAAHAGLDTATLNLKETRGTIIEETALAFVAVQRDQEREAILALEDSYAKRLVGIVQQRYDAGRESRLNLHTAGLTAAQIHLRIAQAADDTFSDRTTLSMLTGLNAGLLQVDSALPPSPAFDATLPVGEAPGVLAAFANARAKQHTAWGDARYLYRPQFSSIFQYNRYATFTPSFKQIEKAYGRTIGADQVDFAIQFNFPIFDKGHQAKARESAADAAKALHDAQNTQLVFNEGQAKLGHSLELLRARTEVAVEERALAQDQLEVTLAQLQAPAAGNGPQLSPRDEQNARIAERDKYLNVVESDYSLHQAEIRLLRQTGGLEDWVRKPAQPAPAPPALMPTEPGPVPVPQP